ncbi:LapA family protein [Paenibacillus sp. CAU 1782]
MKSQGVLISAFAFALVIAIFAVINVSSVEVNFLFAKTNTPLILVILVSTLLGGLTVGSFGMVKIFRLQRTVKTLEKRTAELEAASEPFQADFGKSAFASGKSTLSDSEADAEDAAHASHATDEVK